MIRTSPSVDHFLQVKVAGIRADLEQVYKICRHFCGNFDSLSSGCYRCNIPGSQLATVMLPTAQRPLLSSADLDHYVTEALKTIQSGVPGVIGRSRELMKSVSMHPVVVCLPLLLIFFHEHCWTEWVSSTAIHQ